MFDNNNNNNNSNNNNNNNNNNNKELISRRTERVSQTQPEDKRSTNDCVMERDTNDVRLIRCVNKLSIPAGHSRIF